jgi:hypothetical protein
MANGALKTKGPSPTDVTEEKSCEILRSKLPHQRAYIQPYGAKNANLDGHIEFLKEEGGSTSFKLSFQLKGTNQPDVASYDCEKEFLNYCYQAPEPIALILVNIPQNKVYWRLINRAYIVSDLGIKDIAKFAQKTKRVNFSDDKVIDNNTPELLDVCEKHYADASQAQQYMQQTKANGQLLTGQEEALRLLKGALTSEQEAVASEIQQARELDKQVPQEGFTDLERSFLERTRRLPEKMMLYHAFVYALRPFYLDYRGQEKRTKVRKFLTITEAEERYIIENLTNAEFLGRAGDLTFVTNKEQAAVSLNHYFETGLVDPEQVAELFSDEEDQ